MRCPSRVVSSTRLRMAEAEILAQACWLRHVLVLMSTPMLDGNSALACGAGEWAGVGGLSTGKGGHLAALVGRRGERKAQTEAEG